MSDQEILDTLAAIVSDIAGIDADKVQLDKSFVDDLDIDFAHSITLIEWGRGFTEGLSDSWLDVEIERDHTGATEIRQIRIQGEGPRWQGVQL